MSSKTRQSLELADGAIPQPAHELTWPRDSFDFSTRRT